MRRSQPAAAATCAGGRRRYGVACGGRQPRGLAAGAGELPALLPVRLLSRCDIAHPPLFSPTPRSLSCRMPSHTSPHTLRFSAFSFSLSSAAARAISLSSSTPPSFTLRHPRSSPPFFSLFFPLSLFPRSFLPFKPSPVRSANSPRTRAAISVSPPPPTPITTSSTPRPCKPLTPPSTSTNSTSVCSTLSIPTSSPFSPPSRRSVAARPPSSITPPPHLLLHQPLLLSCHSPAQQHTIHRHHARDRLQQLGLPPLRKTPRFRPEHTSHQHLASLSLFLLASPPSLLARAR